MSVENVVGADIDNTADACVIADVDIDNTTCGCCEVTAAGGVGEIDNECVPEAAGRGIESDKSHNEACVCSPSGIATCGVCDVFGKGMERAKPGNKGDVASGVTVCEMAEGLSP